MSRKQARQNRWGPGARGCRTAVVSLERHEQLYNFVAPTLNKCSSESQLGLSTQHARVQRGIGGWPRQYARRCRRVHSPPSRLLAPFFRISCWLCERLGDTDLKSRTFLACVGIRPRHEPGTEKAASALLKQPGGSASACGRSSALNVAVCRRAPG